MTLNEWKKYELIRALVIANILSIALDHHLHLSWLHQLRWVRCRLGLHTHQFVRLCLCIRLLSYHLELLPIFCSSYDMVAAVMHLSIFFSSNEELDYNVTYAILDISKIKLNLKISIHLSFTYNGSVSPPEWIKSLKISVISQRYFEVVMNLAKFLGHFMIFETLESDKMLNLDTFPSSQSSFALA